MVKWNYRSTQNDLQTSRLIEMLLFSVNLAFDLLPSGEDLGALLTEGYKYDQSLNGINKERADLYKLCEEYDVGITVMKRLNAHEFYRSQGYDSEKTQIRFMKIY